MAAPIVMKNAKLIYKNFAGAPDKFNKNGQMPNFSVIIPEEDVGYYRDELKLNVKKRISRDGNEFYYLKIKVGKYAAIYVRDENGMMNEFQPEMYPELDNMYFTECDISFVTRTWTNGITTGESVYLSEMFAKKGDRSSLYREWMTGPEDETLHD